MSTWDAPVLGNLITITSASPESVGAPVNIGTLASATWPTANKAIFMPFRVFHSQGITVLVLAWMNGATATGNVDMGIYDAAGTKLVSTGSTAQSGTSTIQQVDVTDTLLGPGLYYFALALSSTSGTTIRSSILLLSHKLLGQAEVTSALPLPATVTFATITSAYLPLVQLSARTVV